MSTDSYSNTTAKHQSLIRRAIPTDKTVFHVVDVLACNEKQHSQNAEDYIERVNDTLKKSIRARTNKDWLLNEAIGLTNEVNSYIDKFSLPMPKLSIGDIDTDKLKEKIKQEKIERAKQAKIERVQLLKDNALKIEQWRNGETFFINHSTFYGGYYLKCFCRAAGLCEWQAASQPGANDRKNTPCSSEYCNAWFHRYTKSPFNE